MRWNAGRYARRHARWELENHWARNDRRKRQQYAQAQLDETTLKRIRQLNEQRERLQRETAELKGISLEEEINREKQQIKQQRKKENEDIEFRNDILAIISITIFIVCIILIMTFH